MIRRRSAAVLVLAALLCGCATSAPVGSPAHPPLQDEFLDRLVGNWRVTRSVRGSTVQNAMDARWVLGHQFVRLHMIDVKTPPTYEASVLIGYDATKARYVAHWCDVFGAGYSAVGYGARSGDSVEFRFAYDDGPFFNTFTWHPRDASWTFRGENGQPDGSRTLFMEDRATRR